MTDLPPPVWADSVAAAAAPPKRTFAIASFVVALISLAGFWTGLAGAVIGLVACALAIIAFVRGERFGFALAGLVLGVFGIGAGVLFWAVVGALDWMAGINPSHVQPAP